MEIFVSELPKSCEDCRLCQHGNMKILKKNRYTEVRGCILGNYYKYRSMDDEIDTCPLKQLDIKEIWQQYVDSKKEISQDVADINVGEMDK